MVSWQTAAILAIPFIPNPLIKSANNERILTASNGVGHLNNLTLLMNARQQILATLEKDCGKPCVQVFNAALDKPGLKHIVPGCFAKLALPWLYF